MVWSSKCLLICSQKHSRGGDDDVIPALFYHVKYTIKQRNYIYWYISVLIEYNSIIQDTILYNKTIQTLIIIT